MSTSGEKFLPFEVLLQALRLSETFAEISEWD